MFYAQFVLSKKGPLSKIWLAAHWERKLSKAQIFETNVQDAVDEILKPKVKLSLRTTGHLLLGIVRIYSRKAKYVLADCNEAFLKIKMAFRTGGLADGELNEREAREGSALPVLTGFDDLNDVPDIDGLEYHYASNYQMNQAKLPSITMTEDATSLHRGAIDDDFGDDDFEEKAVGKELSNLGFEDSFGMDGVEYQRFSSNSRPSTSFNGRANASHLLDDPMNKAGGNIEHNDFEADGDDDEANTAHDLDILFGTDVQNEFLGGLQAPNQVTDPENMEVDGVSPPKSVAGQDSFSSSLQLEPLDNAALQQQNQEKVVRQKRKRRLVFDEQKNISGDEMKANMANYSDTIQPLDLAPPTKQLMRLKESGATEKLFSMPGCANAIQDPHILRLYQSHLVLCARNMNNQPREDIHQEMGLVPLDFDNDFLEDQAGAATPTPAYIDDDGAGSANQENLEPEEARKGSMATITSPTGEKRTSTRKSRPHERDEEEEDEDEQVFTRRTKGILHSIAVKLKANDNKIVFEDLFTRGSTKRTAAQKFYALLELHKWQAIEVDQSEPFAPIEIGAGVRMQEALEAA